MADIKRILRKRSWTGRELGILELTNMCELYRQGLEGEAHPKPIVEPARFQKMLDTIRGTEDSKDYNGYIAIYDWLRLHNYIALAHEQQAQFQVERITNALKNAGTAEMFFQYIGQLPLIVTEKQYNAMRDEARSREISGKEDNLFMLVDRALFFYSRQLDEEPEASGNPLRALKEKLMGAKADSPLILAADREAGELSKWELITNTGLLEYYQAMPTMKGEPEEPEAIAQVEDFLACFQEAAAAIVEDIRGKGLIPASFGEGLPAAELWLEPLISWKDLYERDIYGMRELLDADTTLFDGNGRALHNGIAIVRSSDLWKSSRIDEKDCYEPPQLEQQMRSLSLEAYFPEGEEQEKKRRAKKKEQDALAASYSVILGFNTALEMIAAEYDVPSILIFRINIEAMREDIEDMNGLAEGLAKLLTDTPFGDSELNKKKLSTLLEVFPIFDTKAIQIPEENIAAAKELLKDYRAFRGGGEDELRALIFFAGTDQAGAGKEEAHG